MKMKKLSEDHYIIMDDSEIKEGDWIGFPNLKKFVPVQYFGGDLTGGEKKITHSIQPLGFLNEHGFTTANLKPDWTNVEYLPLSEVKEVLGVVDVEKKALEISPVELDEDEFDVNETHRVTWIDGYNQALEDNKEKKYTEEDLRKIFIHGKQLGLTIAGSIRNGGDKPNQDMWFNESIESLQPQTEWEVEFIDGKLQLVKE